MKEDIKKIKEKIKELHEAVVAKFGYKKYEISGKGDEFNIGINTASGSYSHMKKTYLTFHSLCIEMDKIVNR